MSRVSKAPFALVAVALALLLPLEAGYCMYMGQGGCGPAPRAASDATHACCGSGADQAGPAFPDDCPCFQKAPAAKTGPVFAPHPLLDSGTDLITSDVAANDADVATRGSIEPPPDIGPPERPLAAHRLRGPPALS